MDIHNWIMNIYNWIMDIHNWIIDIHNCMVYRLLAFHTEGITKTYSQLFIGETISTHIH